ncbi:MAG: ABC transporter ATP-binding protein [Oscillospiraceae bacterium]|nr:ABC transporter ATP-binding protein [Oscillospiraceae bacterium]
MLNITDLYFSFYTPAGEVRALNGVTLEVGAGEVVGVVGESGSGKSVTASVVAGLTQHPGRVKSGQVVFDGRDILNTSEKEMRRIRGGEISMIFQDPMTSLNPVFTIGNQLIETIRLHTDMDSGAAWTHAVHMLELVGIPNPDLRMKQYPHELSGGMRQRTMIAMALSCQPKLLIADEPTTALDVTVQAQILDLMKNLRRETNAAVILITHDLGIVADICDKVTVMYSGIVVERGTVDEIFGSIAHPYTQGLLGCLPRLDSDSTRKLEPIEGQPVDLLNMPEGCPFAPRCKHTMQICINKLPPEFELSESHTSRCWLHTIPQDGGVSK